MASTQPAPATTPSLAHEDQTHKDQTRNLDTNRLETSISTTTKDAQTEDLDAALDSNQTPTPTITTTIEAQPPSPTQPFCYCLRPSHGLMIGCDNPSCPRAWFHRSCTEFKRAPLPPPEQSWRCIPCRGWRAELERGAPGESDDLWRCPKCGEEVVHRDDWLSDRTSKEPRGCEGCGLKKGERWEPGNMRH